MPKPTHLASCFANLAIFSSENCKGNLRVDAAILLYQNASVEIRTKFGILLFNVCMVINFEISIGGGVRPSRLHNVSLT